MTLRNFGLSFSRQDARRDAGLSWRPAHGVGVSLLIVILIVLALLSGACLPRHLSGESRRFPRTWPGAHRWR
jgi:hypothetical protein